MATNVSTCILPIDNFLFMLVLTVEFRPRKQNRYTLLETGRCRKSKGTIGSFSEKRKALGVERITKHQDFQTHFRL